MSNEIGDRYTCTDPNCGCELVIEKPCGMVGSAAHEDISAMETSLPGAKLRREGSSHAIPTQGDYGSQGATGEGVFGTAGTGDSYATASGRYDNLTASLHKSSPSTHEHSRSETNAAPTCFCGHKMRQIGTSHTSAQSARAGS